MKTKMGITLQQAKDTKSDYIAKLQDEKRKLIEGFIASIDEMIALNIDKIMIKPTRVGQATWDMFECSEEISKSYKDFTVRIHHDPRTVFMDIDVKLADKDWDWGGYGVKREPVVQPKKKRFLWWGGIKAT